MSAKYFLDTNIFVYSFSGDSAGKKKTAQDLIGRSLRDGDGIISYQVVQEFLNVAFHKFKKPLTSEQGRLYLEEALNPLCSIYPSHELFRKAVQIKHENGLHFYDSLIVASAIEGGCGVLYSEDLQDGRKIEGVAIKNPFKQ